MCCLRCRLQSRRGGLGALHQPTFDTLCVVKLHEVAQGLPVLSLVIAHVDKHIVAVFRRDGGAGVGILRGGGKRGGAIPCAWKELAS